MFDKILDAIARVWAAIPFSSATWFVIGILLFVTWLFMRAHRNPNSPIAWEDLIIDVETERTSPYKLGYLIGVIVGTWIVVTFADADRLTFDIFGLYLSFLLGGAGWAAFMRMKSANGNGNGNGNGGYYNRPNYGGGYGNGYNPGNKQRPNQPPKVDDLDDEADAALPPETPGKK